MEPEELGEIFESVFMSAVECGCSVLEASFLAREELAEAVAYYGRIQG